MMSSSVAQAGADDLEDHVVVVLELVLDGGGPEAGQGVRVPAVDGDLERGDHDQTSFPCVKRSNISATSAPWCRTSRLTCSTRAAIGASA